MRTIRSSHNIWHFLVARKRKYSYTINLGTPEMLPVEYFWLRLLFRKRLTFIYGRFYCFIDDYFISSLSSPLMAFIYSGSEPNTRIFLPFFRFFFLSACLCCGEGCFLKKFRRRFSKTECPIWQICSVYLQNTFFVFNR